MKKIDFEIEILNWAKHQKSEKKPSKMLWFRVESDIFFDMKFSTLSVNSKLFWFYLLTEACRANAGIVRISCTISAKISGVRANFVRSAVDDLERLQLVRVLTRRKDPLENTRRGNTNVVVQNSSSPGKKTLTKSHEIGTIETSKSQKSQSAKKSLAKQKSNSAETWESFSNAYRKRYGSDPVRNATTNSQMTNVVKRIGAEEAPAVAEYYLSLNDSWYTKQGHSVGTLLRDCEKIRTMWATKRSDTNVGRKTAHTMSQLERIQRGEL